VQRQGQINAAENRVTMRENLLLASRREKQKLLQRSEECLLALNESFERAGEIAPEALRKIS
jgi:hypothetical protein